MTIIETTTVEIKGAAYEVEPTSDTTVRLTKLVNGEQYTVTRMSDGTVACECRDYQVRHADHGTTCKHGAAMLAMGLLEPVALSGGSPEASIDTRETPEARRRRSIRDRTRRLVRKGEMCLLKDRPEVATISGGSPAAEVAPVEVTPADAAAILERTAHAAMSDSSGMGEHAGAIARSTALDAWRGLSRAEHVAVSRQIRRALPGCFSDATTPASRFADAILARVRHLRHQDRLLMATSRVMDVLSAYRCSVYGAAKRALLDSGDWQRDLLIGLMDHLGCAPRASQYDRFQALIGQCLDGVPVSFPAPRQPRPDAPHRGALRPGETDRLPTRIRVCGIKTQLTPR